MEDPTPYNGIKIRNACLTKALDWKAPSGLEIKTALKLANWSGEEFARRVKVDGRTLRRWANEEKKIPYAAWCVLCSEAGLGKIWQ